MVNHVLTGTRFFPAKRNLLRSIGYEIGENTKIVGPIHNTGTLRIGANCWIGCNLTVHGNGIVTIGDNCDIAPDVTFLTGGHQMGDHNRRAGKGESYHITVGSGRMDRRPIHPPIEYEHRRWKYDRSLCLCFHGCAGGYTGGRCPS